MSEQGEESPAGMRSDHRFRALADVVDGCVVRVAADGRVVGADGGFRDLTGFEPNQVVDEPLAALLGDDADRLRDALGDGQDGGLPEAVRVRTASGQHRECSVDARPVSGADGTGAVVVIRAMAPEDENDTGESNTGPESGGRDAVTASAASENRADVFRRFYERATGSDEPLVDRVRGVLSIIRDAAGTEYGTLSRVEGDAYVFDVVAGPPDGDVTEGDEVSLSETSCERVVDTEESLVLRDIQSAAPDLAERDGNQQLGLSCYLGAPVVVDGDVYGTLCVYGTSTCEFSELTVTLVDLAAAWVEYELEQQRTTDRLRRERETVESTRNRFETLVENFPNGAVALVDDDLRYNTVGGTPVDAETESVSAFDGKTVREAVTEDFADVLEPRYQAALDGERSSFEHEIEDEVVQIRTLPVRDDDGDVVAAMGMSQDITEQKERERELAKYESLVETVDDGIYVVDDDYKFTTVNETFAELTGYGQAELLGEDASLVDDEVDLEVASRIRSTDDSTTPLETTMQRADDSELPVEVTFSSLETPDGDRERIGVVRDVTERHEQRRRIEESERRYRALVENFPDGSAGLFDQNLEYKVVGGDLLDTLDIDPEDRVGNEVFESYPREVTEELEPKFRRALDGEPTSFKLELQGRHLSGDVHPIWNADGSVDTGMVVVQDVTERRENRRRLEKSEQRYRTLFESMDEGFCTFEVLFEEDDEPVDYRFIETNPAFEELTGLTDAEGERMRELAPGHEEHWFETYGRVALTGEPERFTRRAAQLDDRVYDLYAFRIGEPAERKVAVLFDDITERKETEEKLRESEERFRAFVEASSDVVYRMSPDWNEMYRLEGREFLPDTGQPNDSWMDTYIHPDDQPSVTETIEEAIQSKTTFEKEHRVRRDDGTLGWTLSRAVPILDADGEIVEWFGTATDVTERKEHEQFLEDAKAQLEAAAEAGAVGTWEWHVPEDRFVAGASFARTFDIDPDAARDGVSIEQLLSSIHEADRERVGAKIDDTIETCGDIEIEYRVWNADDELRWVNARGHVECDEDGNPVTFPGALTDITERKHVEQELARQRKQLETLVEMLPVAVFMAESGGELIEWNDAAEEIWGGEVAESESVAEYEAYDAWWADTGDPLEPEDWPIARALEGEEVTDPDVIEIEGFDGERRMVLNHATPVRDENGEVDRSIVTLVDITKRREYRQQLKESNERLEQFAYAASHDLQEPLRMVSSYLSLVEQRYGDELDEDGQEFIEYAVDGADRMREMIDALLEYSRVETKGGSFDRIDLDAVVADVRRDFELKIGACLDASSFA